MCIIIDTNVFSRVFNPSNSDHLEFSPVLDWILNKEGKLVAGGKKYHNEIFGKFSKYTKLLSQMKKARKIYFHNSDIVDAKEKEFKGLFTAEDYDDEHILALLSITKCRILCTKDEGLIKYAGMKLFYQSKQKPPLVYKDSSNKNILNKRNIAKVCQPCNILSKSDRTALRKIVKSS
jgi:predicted nucleic acid-binding protein